MTETPETPDKAPLDVTQTALTPSSPQDEQPDTPKAKAKKRSLYKRILKGAAIGLGGLVVVAGIGLVAGRHYIKSDPGRAFILSKVDGSSIGRFGTINIEGLSGDLLSDFHLNRLTVSDDEGVWLEATNLNLNWGYWPLLQRRFHADELTAENIKLLRRPTLGPQEEDSGPSPISIKIDAFKANIDLMEEFSKEYGRWTLSGNADIPRFGAKHAFVDALSLNRPGDFLKLDATFSDKPEELRLDLNAEEANGGPIAGMLGYSPDQPFKAKGLIDGSKVELLMQTGQFRPLLANGTFGENGSKLSGYADFSGSDLFAPFIERIGRTARFGFAAIPDQSRENYQGMAWRLIADNINSTAQGYLRLKDGTYAENIQLDISTPSLSRLAGVEIAQAARYQGVFSGETTRFDLKGNLTLQNLDAADYQIGTLSGPLNLNAKDGNYELQGSFRASNATTQGAIGNLLGSSPTISASLARLKDGNILLRDIDLKGSSLTLKGSGQRNLLGGLSFKADVDLTNASALVANGKGRFGGRLSAGQRGNNAPWTLEFDGSGRDFESGIEIVDTLLGNRPRLRLDGSLDNGVIRVSRGELNGQAANVNATGTINGGKLAFDLGWDAKGPLGIGPVAIDGNMTGNGTLGGTLNKPDAALQANFDQIKLGNTTITRNTLVLNLNSEVQDMNGTISLTGYAGNERLVATTAFSLAPERITLSNLDINGGGISANGNVTLANNLPSTANLNVSARRGLFVREGELKGTIIITEAGRNDPFANIDVSANNLLLNGINLPPIRKLSLKGQGPLSALKLATDIDIGGPNPISYKGSLIYSHQDATQKILLAPDSSHDGRVRNISFRLAPNSFVEFGPAGTNANLKASLEQSGSIELLVNAGGTQNGRRRPASIAVKAEQIPLNLFKADLEGTLSAEGNLQEASNGYLNGTVIANARNARLSSSQQSVFASAVAEFVGSQVQVRACADINSCSPFSGENNGKTSLAQMTGTLPFSIKATPLEFGMQPNADVTAQLQINGEIEPILNIFGGSERKISGQVIANVNVATRTVTSGVAPVRPDISGTVTIKKGRVEDNTLGINLYAIDGYGTLAPDSIHIPCLFASSTAMRAETQSFCHSGNSPLSKEAVASKSLNQGQFLAEGTLSLAPNQASDFTITLKEFLLTKTDALTVRATGKLTGLYENNAASLQGTLTVDEAEIKPQFPASTGITAMPVTEVNRRQTSQTVERRGQSSLPISLNITLKAPAIYVNDQGIDLMLSADAKITGTITQPNLTGYAEVVRGTYEFSGKRFTFEPGGRVTLDTRPSRMLLNLSATREDPSIKAIIRVRGTAAEPRIELSSDPILPQDEILARVLFGRSISQLSPIEAAQLASAVASLAGGGGLDVLGSLREIAHLDSLSFSGQGADMIISGGTRIGNNLYLEVVGGGEAGTSINIEWQARRNVAVTTSVGGDGNNIIAVRWRKPRR